MHRRLAEASLLAKKLNDMQENQPPGRLSSLYEVFFNRLFRDAGMDFQPAGQVMGKTRIVQKFLREHRSALTRSLEERGYPSSPFRCRRLATNATFMKNY